MKKEVCQKFNNMYILQDVEITFRTHTLRPGHLTVRYDSAPIKEKPEIVKGSRVIVKSTGFMIASDLPSEKTETTPEEFVELVLNDLEKEISKRK